MPWQQLQIILPSFVFYWIALVCGALVAWFIWSKINPKTNFQWRGPVLFGSVFCLYAFANTTLTLYQNSLLMAQQRGPASQTPQQVDPIVQAKSEFLKAVDVYLADPSKITSKSKDELFNRFKNLFPSEKEKSDAIHAVVESFNCQRYFWEDALASFNTKKPVKSDSRKACETQSASFLNRDFIVAPQAAKNNDEVIAKMAKHDRLPSADGTQVELTEKMLRDSLDNQIKATSHVKELFGL